jgi:hypothetical protein
MKGAEPQWSFILDRDFGSEFWAYPSQLQLLAWSAYLKMGNWTWGLVDLFTTFPVSVGLFKTSMNSWVRAIGKEVLRSNLFSLSDLHDDSGPRNSVGRLISLNAHFLSVFLGYQTCLLCNILRAHSFFPFSFLSTKPSFSQKWSDSSMS